MDLRLAGKTAIVTGASKGIGLAVTRALVDEGVSVVAAARSLTADLAQLTAQGRVHPVEVDLGTPDGPARLIDETVGGYGGLDVLVNNVGALRPRPDGFLSLTDDDRRARLQLVGGLRDVDVLGVCRVNNQLGDNARFG